jgi:hypothetical protein
MTIGQEVTYYLTLSILSALVLAAAIFATSAPVGRWRAQRQIQRRLRWVARTTPGWVRERA